MDPVARDYEIMALCNGKHCKVGTGHSQEPNKAEPKMNWSLLLWLRRIEENRLGGQGDSRDRGGHGTVGLVCGVNARANITTTDNETAGRTPRWLHAWPQQQCDEHGMAPLLRSAPDTDAKRCDAEVWRCRWTSIERTTKEIMEQS